MKFTMRMLKNKAKDNYHDPVTLMYDYNAEEDQVLSIPDKHIGFNADFDSDAPVAACFEPNRMVIVKRSKGMSRRDRRILRRASKFVGSKVTGVILVPKRKRGLHRYHAIFLHYNHSA